MSLMSLQLIKAFTLRHRWKLIITASVGVPFLLLLFFILRPKQPTYVTAIVARGDLRQTVEAVGTVISDRDLKLQFPSSGIVSEVFVKEGDTVHPGQNLAALRSGTFAADIASAQARVMAAAADMQAKQEGARPEDIAITQADVRSKQASLDAARGSLASAEASLKNSQARLLSLQQEATTSLAGSVSNVGSAVSQQLTVLDNAIATAQGVFANNDVTDAVIRSGTSEYEFMNAAFRTEQGVLRTLRVKNTVIDYSSALAVLDQAKAVIFQATITLDQVFSLLSRLPASGSFSESAREAYKTTVAAQRSSTQSALASIDATSKGLRDASASFQTRIATEQGNLTSAQGTKDRALADIASYDAALQMAQAQLQLKLAPTRDTDIRASMANLQQARAGLASAVANYNNTILAAPIDGIVTKVNVKVGEITPVGPAVAMLGTSPYRIEMFVSEIDVPKVHSSQSGSIELDAFRGMHFKLHVSESDSAATDKDGVSKYRVKLDFDFPHAELKVGMTGDAEIDTGFRRSAVHVPLRAILDAPNATKIVRVRAPDGSIEERPVVTGMESADGNVEIIQGLKAGEVVIVLEKK